MKNLLLFLLLPLLQLCLQNAAIAQTTKYVPQSGIPITWESIKDADILWKKRVWREINVFERSNAPLRSHQANAFATILFNGIKSGAIKAYSNDDTGFKAPLSLGAVDTLIQCDANSLSLLARTYLNNVSKHSSDTTIQDTSFISSCIYPQQVVFFQLIEDWIFDDNKGIMMVRINAIAPAAFVNGETKPLFWLHYPSIEHYINDYKVDNLQKAKTNYTWYQFFESRQFSSKITNKLGGYSEETPNKSMYNKKKGDDSSMYDMMIY